MSLVAGEKLGLYEILSPIGAGGMGEVYRARDTRLKRDVALKVLPEAFARDPGRMARFQREAEVLASLNHSNIAAIYGLEERALVMELVEGESPKGPMLFDEAWKIAKTAFARASPFLRARACGLPPGGDEARAIHPLKTVLEPVFASKKVSDFVR
jgi:serine/threonine protein kinase